MRTMENSRFRFRAWNASGDRYGNLPKKVGMIYFDLNDYAYDQDSEQGLNLIDIEMMPIMQFTGLQDKNGKEIWEGDVVRLGGHETLTALIEWKDCGFVQKWLHENLRTSFGMPAHYEKTEPIFMNSHISLEVLGNIYENPELLEKP